MARCFWGLALCLLTAAAASAQSPGDEGPGDAPRRAPAPSRDAAEEGEAPAEEAPRERGERGERAERGERGGRFGEGRGPGRRGNPLFEAIDADGDGVITNQELRKSIAAIKTLDADGDGKITLAEASPAGGPGGPGGRFGDASQMVDRIMMQDKNGDGRLTLDEVDERTAMMLQRADQNGDRAIDRAEVEAAMEQMRGRFGGGPGGPGGFGGDPQEMTKRMMANDANGDGKLSPNEVPDEMRRMLQGGDLNEDGAIDASEMEQITRRLGGRMRGGFGPGQGGEREYGGRFGRGRQEGGEDDAGEADDRRSRRGRPAEDE